MRWSTWRYLEEVRRHFPDTWFTTRDFERATSKNTFSTRTMLRKLVAFKWLKKEKREKFIKIERDGVQFVKKKKLIHYKPSGRFNRYKVKSPSFDPKDNPFINITPPSINHKYLKKRFDLDYEDFR